MTDSIAAAQLRSYVDRVLRLKEEIKALNADVSEIYKEAAGNGFDKKALQATVKRAGLPREDVQEQDALLDLYWNAYTGSASSSRARAPASATTDTSAPSQGLNGSQPSEPSSDEVPAADAASVPVIPGQSEQAPDPIPAQSHLIRGAEAAQ